MKKIILIALVLLFLGSTQLLMAESKNGYGFKNSLKRQESLLPPYQQDTYGPGINSDATGKPSTWQTNDGQTVQPGTKVKPDVYGPGVGQDEYGRSVKAKTWP
jgi:hypothetical protein